MIGCTTETIAPHFHCGWDTIAARVLYYQYEVISDGQLRIRGKLFKAAMQGSQRDLEVCAVNLCGKSEPKMPIASCVRWQRDDGTRELSRKRGGLTKPTSLRFCHSLRPPRGAVGRHVKNNGTALI